MGKKKKETTQEELEQTPQGKKRPTQPKLFKTPNDDLEKIAASIIDTRDALKSMEDEKDALCMDMRNKMDEKGLKVFVFNGRQFTIKHTKAKDELKVKEI